MGMWSCAVCGSCNRTKDDYKREVRIVCNDCGAIHSYELDSVTRVNEDGSEEDFDYHTKGWRKRNER